MTLNAASELQFSSPAGEANYRAARRRYPAQAIVDLATLRDNMAHLVDVVGGPHSGTAVMGVVKADAYGHGLLPAALAALAGGATWLGTAQSHEALLLRKLGIGPDRCRILTWVYNGMDVPFDELIDNDIDISVGSLAGIDALADAARRLGKPARVHVKVDSGFGRNGFTPAGFDAALAKLVPLAHEGVLHIVGQWSHLAVADSPDVPEFVASTDRQIESFTEFTRRMEAAGIAPEIRHLANTAATLNRPEIHFELTRPGIGLYGYEPDPAMGTPRDWHLKPAMTLQAQLGTVKDVEAGHGVSYGRTYLTPDNTSTAIVPLGYADGIHRSASGFDMQGAKHVEKAGGPVRVMTSAARACCTCAVACAWTSSSSTCTGRPPSLASMRATPWSCSDPVAVSNTASRPPTTGRAPPTRLATRCSPVCAIASRGSTCMPPTCCLPRTSPSSIRRACCRPAARRAHCTHCEDGVTPGFNL